MTRWDFMADLKNHRQIAVGMLPVLVRRLLRHADAHIGTAARPVSLPTMLIWITLRVWFQAAGKREDVSRGRGWSPSPWCQTPALTG